MEDRLQRRLRREERKRWKETKTWRAVFEDESLACEMGLQLRAEDVGRFGLSSKLAWSAAMTACRGLARRRHGWHGDLRDDETDLELLRFLQARDDYASQGHCFASFSARHAVFLTPAGVALACGKADDGRCGLSPDDLDLHLDQVRANRPLRMLLDDKPKDGSSSSFSEEDMWVRSRSVCEKNRIVGCAAGAGHSILLSSFGVVLSCGRGAPQASRARRVSRMATRAMTLLQNREQEESLLLETTTTTGGARPPEVVCGDVTDKKPDDVVLEDKRWSRDKDLKEKDVPTCVITTATTTTVPTTTTLTTLTTTTTTSRAALTPQALRLCSPRMRVVMVSASANHCVCVTACGAALSSGVGAFGRLGHGNEANVTSLKRVRALEREHVISAAAGAAHSLFATARGVAFACGQGEDGRLGLGPPRSRSHSMGDAHATSDIDDDGEDDYDDEGYSATSWVVRRRRATLRRRPASTTPISRRRTPRSPAGLPPGRTADRPGDVTTPRPIAAARFDAAVSRVAAGAYHSLFLTTTGCLYSCGHNATGQLGHTRQSSFAPELVVFDHQDDHPVVVVDVAAGTAHTLCATQRGTAFAWGSNDSGALGVGDDRLVSSRVPIQIILPTISRVAAGGNSSAFQADDTVFVSGQNTDGQLGLGHYDDCYTPAPRLDFS